MDPLTGDNAAGKTTLLKAIALGLCDGSSAAGLLRESDSGYIRTGQKSSRIELRLVRSKNCEPEKKYTITTSLSEFNGNLEHLEQSTSPAKDFPWDDIFVCGYGAGRGTSGTGDITGYSPISAVYNLFNYSEGLQNPELTILRLQQDMGRHTDVLVSAEEILELPAFRLASPKSNDAGISVKDPRGLTIALRDLADGYKSTFLWLTDFLGWALAKKPDKPKDIEGIVIVDEIEQHLHAQLQKTIINKLRETFPRVQFFASTHSPLVARSFRHSDDEGPYEHYHLRTSADGNSVVAKSMPAMGGKRTDQILASEAFDYVIDDDPDAKQLLDSLSMLVGNPNLGPAETLRAQEMADKIEELQSIRLGQTPFEQSVAEWVDMKRGELIEYIKEELRRAKRDKSQ